MPQINLRVGEEQKARWKDTANEDERTLTSFIQHCVETHPEYNDFQARTRGNGLSSETAETIERIASGMDRLTESVDGLDSRVGTIERSLKVEEQTVEETAGEVFSGLPTEDMYTPSEGLGDFGTLEWIASEMDESPRRITKALDYLDDQHMLKSAMIDNSRRYFKD